MWFTRRYHLSYDQSSLFSLTSFSYTINQPIGKHLTQTMGVPFQWSHAHLITPQKLINLARDAWQSYQQREITLKRKRQTETFSSSVTSTGWGFMVIWTSKGSQGSKSGVNVKVTMKGFAADVIIVVHWRCNGNPPIESEWMTFDLRLYIFTNFAVDSTWWNNGYF